MTVEGFLFDDEDEFLYNVAKTYTDGIIIEIGSHVGRSTIALAKGAIDGGNPRQLYTIDPLKQNITTACVPHPDMYDTFNYNILIRNLRNAGVRDKVEVIRNESIPSRYMFVDLTASILFVDGLHDYESIKNDLNLYLPTVMCGGIVIVHDCNPVYPGIMRACKECITPDAFDNITHRPSGSHIYYAIKKVF